MAQPQPETSSVFARDIAVYSDVELDQYLEVNGRARAGANDAAPSPPIDLNYVSARLVKEPLDRETSPRSPSPATSEDPDTEENYLRKLERETESYNKLINDGGRPSHPISLGYNIAKDLEEYREILSFWNSSPNSEYGWMVFGDQLGRWEDFRESQPLMRTDGPLEVGSVFYARPAKPGRFAAYCRGLHKRLTRHGFERSFQLSEALDRQDKLWIEYLGFEYVEYEKHANIMKRLQQQHDEAWKKLVDSEILKPSETEESFKYFFFLQLQGEESEAQKALESAVSSVDLADQALQKARCAGPSKQSLSQMEQKLSIARSNLAAATKSLDQIKRRHKLIKEFKSQTLSYSRAKSDANRQSILLRWILQQVPLIELELNPTKATENDSTRRDGKYQRSLKRHRADDCNEEPVPKRQRQGNEKHKLLESKTSASTSRETSSTQQPRQTRSSHTIPSTLPSKSYSQRAPHASRPTNTKSESAKAGVVLDDGARVRKWRRRKQFSLDDMPEPRILRRSSRPKRPPERFQ